MRSSSLNKEVTTGVPTNLQPVAQPTAAPVKFDNCVSKFAFATKTGY